MTQLEKCECGNKATIYSFTTGKWECRYCYKDRTKSTHNAPGFILNGKGWPGKEIKNGTDRS